ncbi:MAG: gliding motility-associated-like protein [Saprospiraceae bacterium]|jgi:gliding motility-associated-like protein
MKYSLFLVMTSLFLSSSCKRSSIDNVELAPDPTFYPGTTDHEIIIGESNDFPCLYENNLLRIHVDSLSVISAAWYIIREGDKILMSNSNSLTIAAEADYELYHTFNNGSNDEETVVRFSIDYCGTELMFSDAFSPNGDGQYDEWKVIAEGVSRFSCVVKNGKGTKVFAAENVEESWDGDFEGNKMPSGTYVYMAEGAFKNGKLFEYKGTIELIR